MAKLVIWIDFEPSGSTLSPSMVRLLEAIQKHGTIRRAAAESGMSYRKAWLLLQQTQKTFNGPVINAGAGGHAGGGTQLTDLGVEVLTLYRAAAKHSSAAAQENLEILTKLVRHNAPPRRMER
jgi:molybdate transport system regulatory protein